MVITDHSQSLKVAHGLQVDRLLRQNEEIKQLNEEYKGNRHIFRNGNGHFT